MYSYIEAAEAENCERHTHFSICVVNKTIHSHRDMQHMQDSHVKCFVFWGGGQYLQTLVHIMFCFKYNDLLLIYPSKIWQIPWHSMLYSKFCFYDWIPHHGNHRALFNFSTVHIFVILFSSSPFQAIFLDCFAVCHMKDSNIQFSTYAKIFCCSLPHLTSQYQIFWKTTYSERKKKATFYL